MITINFASCTHTYACISLNIYIYTPLCMCTCPYMYTCMFQSMCRSQEDIKVYVQRSRSCTASRLIQASVITRIQYFSILNLVNFSIDFNFKFVASCCINSSISFRYDSFQRNKVDIIPLIFTQELQNFFDKLVIKLLSNHIGHNWETFLFH